MKKLQKAVYYPNWKILIIYSIISFIAITGYVWRISFSWPAIIPTSSYYIFLLVILIILLITSIWKDKKHNYKLKKYYIISILQLIIIWSIASPIKRWQIESSYKKSEQIIEALEVHKEKYGSYPESLSHLSETNETFIPKWTNLGTKYIYTYYDEQTYALNFMSYRGCFARYHSKHKIWFVTD